MCSAIKKVTVKVAFFMAISDKLGSNLRGSEFDWKRKAGGNGILCWICWRESMLTDVIFTIKFKLSGIIDFVLPSAKAFITAFYQGYFQRIPFLQIIIVLIQVAHFFCMNMHTVSSAPIFYTETKRVVSRCGQS